MYQGLLFGAVGRGSLGRGSSPLEGTYHVLSTGMKLRRDMSFIIFGSLKQNTGLP